jgi:hypothetical protein
MNNMSKSTTRNPPPCFPGGKVLTGQERIFSELGIMGGFCFQGKVEPAITGRGVTNMIRREQT